MLKANVGLSRKISRDFNSTGYSVNIEGEIPVPVDDAKGVLEKVQELFSLAQEALNVEIDQDQGEHAIGRHDEERPQPKPDNSGSPPVDRSGNGSPPRSNPPNAPGGNNGQDQATNKQIQFLLTMGKRFKLSTPQLEKQIAEIIGHRCGVYELTKKEAGLVLDQLTKSTNGSGNERPGR